ncbi:MAG: AzlC family ABC transporter permease [Lachnospiraceae bacterium]|nr:AzlC family ABC transporter permease [Candidatus Colinaster scatohippi]
MWTNKQAFRNGNRDGIPIALGYFAVAFTLGIAAKNAGFTALQAMVVSATNLASAGQYAGFTMVKEGATYLQMALMILVANARYMLMSSALSQKFSPDTPFFHRFLVGYSVTDEVFGICIAVPGKLNPMYAYGAMLLTVPGWSLGTYFGVLMGNILPANVVSALSVGLYGMFIAIIIPPSRKDKLILSLVVISMVLSFVCDIVPLISAIPSGIRIMILTVVIASVAAILFPVKDDPYAVKDKEEVHA